MLFLTASSRLKGQQLVLQTKIGGVMSTTQLNKKDAPCSCPTLNNDRLAPTPGQMCLVGGVGPSTVCPGNQEGPCPLVHSVTSMRTSVLAGGPAGSRHELQPLPAEVWGPQQNTVSDTQPQTREPCGSPGPTGDVPAFHRNRTSEFGCIGVGKRDSLNFQHHPSLEVAQLRGPRALCSPRISPVGERETL